MEDKKNINADFELKDEEMDDVSGGGNDSSGSEPRRCANPDCNAILKDGHPSDYCSSCMRKIGRIPHY